MRVGLHVHARRKDPTHTTTLRNKLTARVNKRFRKLRGDIRDYLAKRDTLTLTGMEQVLQFVERRVDELILSDKAESELQTNRVAVDNPQVGPVWMASLLNEAWQRGLGAAANDLSNAGQVPGEIDATDLARRQAIRERQQAMAERSLSELKSVTNEMQTVIRRELTDGIEQGANPLAIADKINKRIKLRSQHRAKLIARTEVIRSHHKAKMASFRDAGAIGVKVEAEFLASDDSRVCPECAALDGQEFALDRVEGMIPVHPNCRCTVRPQFEQ